MHQACCYATVLQQEFKASGVCCQEGKQSLIFDADKYKLGRAELDPWPCRLRNETDLQSCWNRVSRLGLGEFADLSARLINLACNDPAIYQPFLFVNGFGIWSMLVANGRFSILENRHETLWRNSWRFATFAAFVQRWASVVEMTNFSYLCYNVFFFRKSSDFKCNE